MDARVPIEGVPPLADTRTAHMGTCSSARNDYQAISYYADPLAKKPKDEKKEIDPELMKTFDKLGIPLEDVSH